jgi:hypothetical protein
MEPKEVKIRLNHETGEKVILPDPKVIKTRNNRKTGATILLVDNGGVWTTTCETHGAMAEHPTRRIGTAWMAEPMTWCEGCAKEVAK